MSAIIFDFDGTIADTIEYFQDYLGRKAKHTPLTDQERRSLHGMTLYETARAFGHPHWRLVGLYFGGRREMTAKMGSIRSFPGIVSSIRKLHAEGHSLFIVSSNSERNIKIFLDKHRISHCFVEVQGGAVLFHKQPAIKRLLRAYRIVPKDTIIVGDEVRDVIAAHLIGARSIAVGWGFAHPIELVLARPTRYANSATELLTTISEL